MALRGRGTRPEQYEYFIGMRIEMTFVTLSPDYGLVIPREAREALGLRPGQVLRVFQNGQHITLIPDKPVREMRGSLRGIDTNIDREPDRL